MKLYKLVAIYILLLSAAASAQVGRTGVPFLLIAPGARAAGMGEAFIAISDDATAVHWNPAGLGRYPLTGAWLNMEGSSGDTIQSVVLIKNNLPEGNYRQYDMWGIVNGRLAKWNGVKWVDGTRQDLKAGGSLQSVIVRYTGLSEEDAEPYVNKLARANNQLAPESIDSLRNMLVPRLPDDYLYKEEVQYGFEKLHKTWLQLRINMDGFNLVRNDIYTALADSVLSEEKLDKVAFGFDRAIASKGDRGVWIPFNLIIPDTINCLSSDDENLFVGTNRGLYRMDPEKYRWSSFTTATDSMPSDNVLAIQKTGRHSMFIGTDQGVANFNGRNVRLFPPDAGAPTGRVDVIASESDRNTWASSNGDLYHYDGFKWSNAKDAELSIGETMNKAVERYYGELGAVHFAEALSSVRAANSDIPDTTRAGQIIRLPYRLGYKGEITALGVDSKGRVWIGTTTGVSYLDAERFHLFGYKLYEAKEPTTVQDVAAQYIPDRNQEKVDKLAALIKDFNNLNSDQVGAGSRLLVYSNALGSEVRAIAPMNSKETVVATEQGIVEYRNGKWQRMHNVDTRGADVSGIYSRSRELWLGGRNNVSVYAAPKKQITFMHSNYLVQLASDLYYEYFSFVLPTNDWGTFGLGVTFLSLGKQIRTNEFAGQEGLFYTYEMAVTLSYGTKLVNNVYGGISLRYINSHLSDAGAGKEKGNGIGYSVAVDGGLIYDMTRRLTLATTITNIGPDIAYIDADQADPLPRKFAVGFLYKLIDSPFNKLSVVGEGTKLLVDLNDPIKTEIEEVIPHIGLEYWYSNYVALRGGYVYDKIGVQRYFTLGASLQYTNYRFDFSYIPSSNEETNRLGNTIRFSMNVGF